MAFFRDKSNNAIYDIPEDGIEAFATAAIRDNVDIESAHIYQTKNGLGFMVGESKRASFQTSMADKGWNFGTYEGKDKWNLLKKNPKTGSKEAKGTDLGLFLRSDLEKWSGYRDSQAAKKAKEQETRDFLASAGKNMLESAGRNLLPVRPNRQLELEEAGRTSPSLFFGQGSNGAIPAGIPTTGTSNEQVDTTTNLAERMAGAPVTGIAKGLAQIGQTGGGVTSAVGRFSEHVVENAITQYNNVVQTIAPKFFEERGKKNRAASKAKHGGVGAITADKGGVSRFIQNVGETARDFHAETLSELERDFPTGDITKNPELMLDPVWWTQSVAQMVTVIGGSMALGGGSLAGAAVMGSTMEAEPFFRELEEKGVPVDEAFGKAVAFGTVVAKLNHIGLDKIFNGKGTSALRRRLSAALAEGSTEFAESPVAAIIEAAGEEGLTPSEFGGRMFQAVRDGINEGVPAFATGGLAGGGGSSGPSTLQTSVKDEIDIDRDLRREAQEKQKAIEDEAQTIVSDPVAAQAQRDADKGAQGDGSDLSPLKPIEDTPKTPDDAAGQPSPSKAVTAEKATPAAQTKQVVYHGTPIKGLTELDPKMAVEVDGVTVFSSDKDVAEQYMFEREYGETVGEEEGSLIEAVLDIKNPMEVDFEGRVGDVMDVSPLIKEAKSKGHDGLIIRNIDDSVDSSGLVADSYFVFDKSQIKTPSQPKQEAAPVTPSESTAKPVEQMTSEEFTSSERDSELPKEYVLSDDNGNFVTKEKNGNYKVWRHDGTHAKLAGTIGFKGEEGLSKAKSRLEEVSREAHEVEIGNGIRSKRPVSAVAVDEYGVKLPEGWTREGELYVPPKTTAPVTPKVTEPKAKKAAEPKATPDDNTIKLTHAETASALEAMGEKPDGKLTKRNEDVLTEAKAKGLDEKAVEIADEVLDKPRTVTDVEHAGMVLKAGAVKNEIRDLILKIDSEIDAGRDVTALRNTLDARQNTLKKLINASDRAGSEAGRALQIRKIRVNLETFTLENMHQRMKAAKQKPLTEKESQRVTKDAKIIEELQKTIDRLENELRDIGAKGEADAAIVQARSTRKKRSKEAAGKDIVSLKKQLTKLGYRVHDITGVPALTIEAAKIIRKLAFAYVDSGVTNLAEVREKLQADIPDLSDKGVYDSIAGRIQRLESRAATETKKIRKAVVAQAKKMAKILSAYDKVFDTNRKGNPTIDEVNAVKKLLSELEVLYGQTETDQESFDDKMSSVNDMRKELDNLLSDVRPDEKLKKKLIRDAEKEVGALIKDMSKIEELADLSEQLRTGNFKKPKPNEKSKSTELDDLNAQIKFAKEQIARITSGESRTGKTDASVVEDLQKSLTEVKDQIDKGYRKLPLPVKARGERVKQVRQELKEMLDLRRTNDRIEELNRRIRDRDFAVTAKEGTAIKSKQLAEARIKMLQLQRDARSMEFKLKKKSFWETFGNVASFPRSMLATMDMSYALRQAIIPSIAHPKIATKAFAKAFVAFYSQKKADAVDIDLKNHKLRPVFDKYGLYFSSMDQNLSMREEAFVSNMAERIWGFGKIVLASERNMVTGLNLLRAGLMTDFLLKNPHLDGDVLDKQTKALSKEITALEETQNESPENKKAYEKKLKELTELQRREQAKYVYARYVNIATGRGDLMKLNGAAESLSILFFAPRFAASRIQAPLVAAKELTMAAFGKGNKEVAREIGKQWAFYLGTGQVMLQLARLAGASVSIDPDDSDWGKIVIGNIHIDIWGGEQQPMRLLALATKGAQQAHRNETSDFSIGDVGRFISYKLSPAVGLGFEQITRKNFIGQKVDDKTIPTPIGDINIPWRAVSALSKVIPIIVQSGAEAYTEGEDPKTVVSILLGESLGLSISVYKR